MSRLDKALESVPAESLPAAGDLETVADPTESDPEPTGEQGAGGDPENQDGRNLDNVRGEFDRKFRKAQADNQRILTELEILRSKLDVRPGPAPQSEPQTLDDMSLAALKKMRPGIEEANLPAFDAYVSKREGDDELDKRFNAFEQKQSFKTAEQRAKEQAVQRWPQLQSKESEFYRVTSRIYEELGPSADINPRAVLDAANEAGYELGQTPQSYRPTIRRDPGGIQSGRTTRPTQTADPTLTDVHSEEHQAIRARLANALPSGKFTPEQIKRIEKRQKVYDENLDLFVRG